MITRETGMGEFVKGNEGVLVAYIDPVSGNIVLQMILAGVLGAGAYFRQSVWRLLARVFGKTSD